jgi:hypothetical protein
VYENILDPGWFLGDSQLGPICEYMSTGEFSTQSTGRGGFQKSGLGLAASIKTRIYNALHQGSATLQQDHELKRLGYDIELLTGSSRR